MKVIQEMDILSKITRKTGITFVPMFMILLIETLQVNMSLIIYIKFICICKNRKNRDYL